MIERSKQNGWLAVIIELEMNVSLREEGCLTCGEMVDDDLSKVFGDISNSDVACFDSIKSFRGSWMRMWKIDAASV